ncbi:tripartite motif-containing 13-like [Asterias amurensis]|uniref:tripartite motif-containing 13-like n=1 Tax=Asterias amurensis TaxID=7602 RepID=UPI003AB4EB88
MSSVEFALSSHFASQLECVICMGKLVVPKLLTCGHTFCLGCLDEILDDNEPRIVCPLCRDVTIVPSEGVDGLTTNFALQSLLESLNLNADEVDEPEDEENESTPKSGEVEDGELTMCELHKEKMKFYCSTCELLICRDCTVVDHPRPGHKCTNLDEAYTWRQQINQKELQLAKGLIKLTKKSRGVLLATVENLNQRCDQVINEIEVCRQEGMKMLNNKDALIKEYQCSLEEHTQDLLDLTQHAKGTTKIDVLDQSKSLVETLSSYRDKRHVMLDTPSKVQYPMFVGAEEEVQGWPRPSGPRKGNAKPNNKKKCSQEKTSESETDSTKGPNLALGGGMKGGNVPQATYPPLPLMYMQQTSVPGGVSGEPHRGGGGGGGRGGKSHRGGQGHRGGNQGQGGQGQKRGGGRGGRGGQGCENQRGGKSHRGGQGHRGGNQGQGGQGQKRGGGRGGRGGQGCENQRGRGGQAGNKGRGIGHQKNKIF